MKVVVLFSGGIDSTTLVYDLLKNHPSVFIYPLYVDYGQKQGKSELQSIKRLYDNPFFTSQIIQNRLHEPKIVDIISTDSSIFKTSLVSHDMKVPNYPSDHDDTTHVIMRECLFASLGTTYAHSIGANYIYMMNHKSDNPEIARLHLSNNEAIHHLKSLVKIGSNNSVELRLPFINFTKLDVLKFAKSLNVPLDKCWTCYNSGTRPCGKCKSCYERNKAFKQLESELIK